MSKPERKPFSCTREQERLQQLCEFQGVHNSGDLLIGVELLVHAGHLTDEELGSVVRLACAAEYWRLPDETRRTVHERNGWPYPPDEGCENGAVKSKPCGNGSE